VLDLQQSHSSIIGINGLNTVTCLSQHGYARGFKGRVVSHNENTFRQGNPTGKIVISVDRILSWASGMLGVDEAARLTDVPNMRQQGTRLGNWLTREQARDLLTVPDRSTLKGKRDYAILALLVSCALRRQELATLDVQTIQMREGRWVLADLVGKGRRVRTVAVPLWVKQGINAWMAARGEHGDMAGLTAGPARSSTPSGFPCSISFPPNKSYRAAARRGYLPA